jgi:hypothetical protein
MSRESEMVTLRRDDTGKPRVWCDPEIADLVDALNTDTLATRASCSGHGERPGSICMRDGRVLMIFGSLGEYHAASAALWKGVSKK